MASATTSLRIQTRLEDVLECLPVSGITNCRKGHSIYGPNNPSQSIYLVVSGKVGISQIAENGREVLLEIVRPDELFGESAFLGNSRLAERAEAIEEAKVMTWPISDMEDLVTKRPRLAVALLQVFAQRNAEFTRRIESFSIDTIERRLARSLLHFSERLGTPEKDGSVWMMPFTHLQLSRYVGTSRELVTHHMNRFRKQGYMNYSHRGIVLYRDNLKTVLAGIGPPSTGASS